jgi:uracil-DNA glycosylase
MSPELLQNIIVHPDWDDFLTTKVQVKINDIDREISKSSYTPSPEKVLRFLTLPLSAVKIIIVGQDPYPQVGVATGRAFEVGTLKSWNEPFNNVSLKNILRAIYKAYTGEVKKFNELRAKFDNEFPVLPPNKLFINWEDQGVLLLNTCFTCEIGKSGSHKKIWEDFSADLFSYINKFNNKINWFLWGAHAVEATKKMQLLNYVRIMHPMMCFNKSGRESDFLYGNINCFELFKNEINWTGYNSNKSFKPPLTLF